MCLFVSSAELYVYMYIYFKIVADSCSQLRKKQ